MIGVLKNVIILLFQKESFEMVMMFCIKSKVVISQ